MKGAPMIIRLIPRDTSSENGGAAGGTMRGVLAAILLGALAWASQAEAATRCVVGVKAPPVPPGAGCIFYDDLAAAMADAAVSDEVRVFGSVKVPSTVS